MRLREGGKPSGPHNELAAQSGLGLGRNVACHPLQLQSLGNRVTGWLQAPRPAPGHCCPMGSKREAGTLLVPLKGREEPGPVWPCRVLQSQEGLGLSSKRGRWPALIEAWPYSAEQRPESRLTEGQLRTQDPRQTREPSIGVDFRGQAEHELGTFSGEAETSLSLPSLIQRGTVF